MRYGRLAVFMATSFISANVLLAADVEPIGRVTAAFGVAAVETPEGVRKGDLHTMINNGDRIRTNGGGVTVLLASRVVVKIDHDTTISVSESPDQLNVVLEKGTVHVFVGKRPLASGAVCVQDPQVRAESLDGVFLVSYDPTDRSGYYACEHSTLSVETGDNKSVTLSPDKQVVVENGQLQEPQELDRTTFAQRKVSLERLGQAVKHESAQTFRMRSRIFDTELALNQLSEAGWIDARTLQANAQQKKAAAKKKTSEDGNAKSDEESEKTEQPAAGDSNTNETASTDAPAPAEQPAAVPETPVENTPDEPVLAGGTINMPVETSLPADSVERPGPAVDLDVVDRDNSGPRGNIEFSPPAESHGNGNAFGHENRPVDDVRGKKMETPKLRLDLDQPKHNDKDHKGGGDVVVPRETVVTPAPVTPTGGFEIEPISGGGGTVAPPIDLDVDNATPAPKPTLDLDIGSTGGGSGGVTTPAPKIDLDIKSGGSVGGGGTVVAPVTPKINLDFDSNTSGGGNVGAPAPKLDLGFKAQESTPNAPAPKLDLDLKPKHDLDSGGPKPKLDLDFKDAAKGKGGPRIDLDVKNGSSGPGGGGHKTMTAAPSTPKLDNVAPPTKIDLGLKGATDSIAPPPAKIDLGLKAPVGGNDFAGKGVDIKLPNEAIAPPTKIDLDLKNAVPVDIKTPGEVAPQPDLKNVTGDLPGVPKIDLGAPTDGGVNPKIDLGLQGVTDGIAKPDLKADDLKLDAPQINVPTDLVKDALPTKDGVVGDLPSPKDLGLDVTKDAVDGAKDAADVAKDATRDRSGHDGNTGKSGKKGRKGKG